MRYRGGMRSLPVLAVLVTACAAPPPAADAWTLSDRAQKTDFQDVDAAATLQKVVDLPVSTWRYKVDRGDIRHHGPVAQDFYAAFGLWNSDRAIYPLDAAGVALSAIQALHARVVAAEAENQRLLARLDALEQRLAALEPASP